MRRSVCTAEAKSSRARATAPSKSVPRSLGVSAEVARRAAPKSVVDASSTRSGAPARMTATESPSRAEETSSTAPRRARSKRVNAPDAARMLIESSTMIAIAIEAPAAR
jgi:hypothetical protein